MTMEKLSIHILTWNLAKMESPPTDQLQSLLQDISADMIGVGLQEVNAQSQNVITDVLHEDSRSNAFRDMLAKNDYVKVHSINLLETLFVLYSKRRHLTFIRLIETSYTRIGFKGFWGNKGAVSIRFNYKGCSVCLVNSHLTPHDKVLANRVADYHTIIKSQTFASDTKVASILDHDVVLWFGDLNFRLNSDSFSTDEIIDLVSRGDTKLLLEQDELTRTISENKAFEGFSECEIEFKPTYKFIPNTQDYDRQRRPAWTDRILYKCSRNSILQQQHGSEIGQITCNKYQSHSQFTISDHKPVSAQFNIKFKRGLIDVVTLELIKPWTVDTKGKILLTLPPNVELSSRHWIAFYREQFVSINEYVSYLWLPQLSPLPGESRKYEIRVPEDRKLTPGKYLAAYMTGAQPYHVLGMSSVFEITSN